MGIFLDTATDYHAHIHLFPINNEADVDFKKHVKLSDEEMKDTADKIFEAFQKL